jgi:hemoglobin
MKMSLFEQLGGAPAVEEAVERFYEKVLADSRINAFFEGVDMDRQRKHQVRFLTYAFGGSPTYNGRGMRVAHERLVREENLNDAHFDAVLENLAATLADLGIAGDLIAQVGATAESIRDDVLAR